MSRKEPFILFRILGALFVIGLIVGAGAFGYKAGVAQGISQAPEVAKAIEKSIESGQDAPITPMYGYGYGYPMYGHPHFGFFPLGGICFSILILFFFLGMMKAFFFHRMAWAHYGGHHGPLWMRHHNHWHEEDKEGEQKDESPEETK